MEWKDMPSLLARTLSRFGAVSDLREVVTKTLSEDFNLPVVKENLSIKGNLLFVHAHPAVKNEILLKKEKIISFLRERTKGALTDIR